MRPDLPQRRLFRWGHLDVLEQVGRGSFGDVFRARDTRLDREVALKLRRSETAPDASARRFLDEARGLARVTHPNIVVVHGASTHRGRAGFWTEFIRGETLAERLRSVGPLGAEEAALIGFDTCRALAAVHGADLVHGDVKLENVMRAHSGRIVLMDFGAASRMGGEHGAALPARFLTPLAAAPEVLDGAPPTPGSDVYALGVLLYRLVANAYPLVASSIEALREAHRQGGRIPLGDRCPHLPEDFERIVEKALAPPADRYGSAEEMASALRMFLRARTRTGGDALQSLRGLQRELGQVPERVARHAAREIARALVPIHGSGAAHGAIRLENIYLDAHGGVELADTATVEVAETADVGVEGRVSVGAAGDPDADLRALGGVLYQLVTGTEPVVDGLSTIRRAGRLNAQLSPFFEEVLHDLLTQAGDSRFDTATELADVLLDGERSAWWRERSRAIRLATRKPIRRIRIRRETTLYGRTRELERLGAAWAHARRGEGRVVLLEGEAGIGKTRLVDEFVGGLEENGEELHFLFGTHVPGGAATPTGAFISAYRDQLGTDRLNETLAEYLPDAPVLSSAFAALLRDEPVPSASQSLDKRAIQSAFIEVTNALAAERPTVVMIDDLHFASAEGLAIFAAIAAAIPSTRVLLVGGSRPELKRDWLGEVTRLDHAERVELPRLAPGEVLSILSDTLGTETATEPVVQELAARSDGNPFFLFEILRARGDSPEEPQPIPSSIEQLVESRVSALRSDRDRELLDVACCVGFRFDPTVISHALRLDEIRVLRRFGRMESARRLVRSVGLEYVFEHHLIQEVVYASLAEPLRRRYHSAIATALRERLPASDWDNEAFVGICEHELRGLCPERALPHLRTAFDHLRARHANAAAITLTDLALGVPGLIGGEERARWLLARTERLSVIGDRGDIPHALNEAVELARVGGAPALIAEIEIARGLDHRLSARLDRAIEVLESAIANAQAASSTRLEGSARREYATVLHHRGRNEQAKREFELAIELSERAGDRRSRTLAQGYLGSMLWSGMGNLTEGEHHIREALDSARELNDLALESSMTASLGVVFMDRGHYEASIPLFERLIAIARETGYRQSASLALVNLGTVFHELGRYERALDTLQRAIALSKEITAPDHEAAALVTLGIAHAATGDFDEARSANDAAREVMRLHGFAWLGGQVDTARGEIEDLAGDLDAAARYYEHGVVSAGTFEGLGRTVSLLVLAGAESRLDRVEAAEDHAREALRIALEKRYELEALKAEIELVFLSKKDLPDMLTRLADREARFPLRERARLRFRLFGATGDDDHLAEARRIVCELIDEAPASHRERMRTRVGLYRDVLETWRRRAS